MMVTGLALALSTLVASSQEDAVVLTPDTMADHGFVAACLFLNWTGDEGAETGEVTVRFDFDPELGPTINEIRSFFLVVREGDALVLSVPVEVPSDPELRGVSRVQFTIHRDMLPKSKLILENCGEGHCRRFTVDLDAFADAN